MFYGLLKWLEMFNILCMLSFDQIKTSLRARGMWINIQDGVCISMQILMEKYQDILSQPDQECDQILHHSSQQSSSWIWIFWAHLVTWIWVSRELLLQTSFSLDNSWYNTGQYKHNDEKINTDLAPWLI